MTHCVTYSNYSYSEVPWIGDIPSHWNCVSLKNLDPYNSELAQTGPFGAQLHADDYVDEGIPLILIKNVKDLAFDTSDMPKITTEDANRLSSYKVIPGDIVFSRVGSIGRIALVTSNEDGWVISGQMLRLRINNSNLDEKFCIYALSSKVVENEISYRSVGSTRESINTEILRNIKVPFPPVAEQRKIANFLDYETAKIDTLIEMQQQLIKLLKEKRQSVISHAVTKGLNPNAPMRDSSVEWLGEVPEHWEVIYIKHLSTVKRGASPRPIDDQKYFDEVGEYSWVRIADVSKAGMYLTSTTQRLSDLGATLSVKLEANQLFVSIAGTVGKPCITISKACIHDGFVYFPELKTNIKFLYYIFEAGEAYLGLGKMGTQLNLNTETVGGIKVGLPPLNEIDEIISAIEHSNEKYDDLISKANKSIGLMQERRTALISAAVTGKIDVRNWSSGNTDARNV